MEIFEDYVRFYRETVRHGFKILSRVFLQRRGREEDVKKYMRLINDSSKARLLDLRKLNEELPIADKSGEKKTERRKCL